MQNEVVFFLPIFLYLYQHFVVELYIEQLKEDHFLMHNE